ncbi:MAG: S9 family peptidase [Planctomycetota bacterium]
MPRLHRSRFFSLVLLAGAPLLVPRLLPSLPAQGRERIRFEDLSRRPFRWVSDVPSVRWAPDHRHVIWKKEGEEVWIDAATGKEVEAKKLPDGAAREDAPLRKIALVSDGDLYLQEGSGMRAPRAARPAKGAVRLTEDGKEGPPRKEAHLSPDGKRVSFVRGNDLFVLDIASLKEWRVTDDGGPERFHGYLDWVYQEEVYGRGDFQGHWWSPDGKHLAFLSLEESAVKDFTIVKFVPEGFLDRERSVETEVANYPKAGDPNPKASLSVARPDAKKVVPVDLSPFGEDVLVVRVDWTPDGRTLLLTLQDRIQTTADLLAVDPDKGTAKNWIHEESSSWVNRPESPRWLADGSFLWLSERTGYNHVYRYGKDGRLLGAVTSGDWQVRSIVRIDEKKGLLWFEGTKDGATGRNVYRIGLDGKGLVRLTRGRGTHAVEFGEDAGAFLDRWSAMDSPPSVRLCSGDDGSVILDFGTAGKGDAARYAFSERKPLSIRARDGFELDASLIEPVGFDPSRRYPVFLPTYSGPDAPSVRDAWSPNSYHVFLAQQGFLILQVNVRSASNLGQKHIASCYRRLGVQELMDLEDAVDFVCRERGGDPARVAIDGWSYGGFMAAYALTHSKKFAVGIAGAGVYDWRLYDTIYTERYMRTPQENAAGYDASSVIKAAKDLHGFLAILHGTMDDNVHLQNAMQLLWELEKAGKTNFEVMFYPRSRHGPHPQVMGHVRKMQWRALSRLLDPSWKPE